MIKFKQGIFHQLFFVLLFPSLSFAQSATVATENEEANECYQVATSVATIRDFELKSNMIEPCNVALIEYGLSEEDRAATFVNRGILNAASGSLADALADYEEAFSIQPNLGEVFINRGFLYHFEEQLDLALNDYNRALELDIQSKYLVYFARGIVFEERNLWHKAIQDYTKSLELNHEWEPSKARLQQVLEIVESSGYEIVVND